MSEQTDLQIRIFSAVEAQRWVHGWPTVVVSLVNPEDRHLVAVSPRPDLVTLQLYIADVTDPDHEHAAGDEHIGELVDLGRRVDDGAKMLFHCRGGIGRSPAAATICLVAAGWSPVGALEAVCQLRRQAKPNGWLLLLADRHLARSPRDGAFSAYVDWAQRQPWWHPLPGTMTRDAVAGRLSWDGCIDLVKAQTHRTRGVDLGPHR